MKRLKVTTVMLGIAIAAGFVGQWIGQGQALSFAQEQKPSSGSPAANATEADRGWIGLMVETGDDKQLRVAEVFPGGPSAFAGVRQGDVVVQVGDVKIGSEEQLSKAVEQLAPGKEIVLTIARSGKNQSVKVRAGSLKEFHAGYAREMMRRDPRDPNYATMHGVSQADMNVEMFRRLFEQNQRLEKSLLELHKEVAALRGELKGKTASAR